MILGTSGNVHDPQHQLFLTLDTPKIFKTVQGKSRMCFGKAYVGKSRNLKKRKRFRKDACHKLWISVFSVSPNKKYYIWNQYLPKDMKLKSLNFKFN